jgi:hypothetical protein
MARKIRRGVASASFGRPNPWALAMKACASARHWGRPLVERGRDVRLIVDRRGVPMLIGVATG